MTTTPPLPRASDQAAERTLFEVNHCAGNKQIIRRNEHGDYVLPSIQDAWAGFQARAAIAHSAAQAPEGASLECEIIARRIAIIPENEGGFHAHEYGSEDTPKAKGYGGTPSAAINALLTTPAAPTCTPADERVLMLATAQVAYPSPSSGLQKSIKARDQREAFYVGWLARAAQDAGTAPVVCKSCTSNAVVLNESGNLNINATTPPAPVSTAAAPTCKPAQAAPEAPTCTGCDPAEGFCRACREAERNAAPEAPATEQQAGGWRKCPECEDGRIGPNELCQRCNQSGILPAATTASASIDMPEFRTLIQTLGPTLRHLGSEYQEVVTFIDSRAADGHPGMYAAGSWGDKPCVTNAADGQQGASRAALTDEQIIAALHARGIDTYPSKYGFDAVQVSATSIPTLREVIQDLAAIAHAPLPAQAGAIDLVVEANRQLLLDRSRVGIVKYGAPLGEAGLKRKQLIQHALEEALDLANYLQADLQRDDAQSRAQSDTTGGSDA